MRRADTRHDALVCGHDRHLGRRRHLAGLLFVRAWRAASDRVVGVESLPVVLSTDEDLSAPRIRRERRLSDRDGTGDVSRSLLAVDGVLRTIWCRRISGNYWRVGAQGDRYGRLPAYMAKRPLVK